MSRAEAPQNAVSVAEPSVEAAGWTPGAACPRCADITALVLFGATGDLTRRKLIPAIYSLTADQLLPCGLPIISIGRRAKNRDELLAGLRQAADKHARRRPVRADLWDTLADNILYVRGELDDPATYRAVSEALAAADEKACRSLNRLFYLAVPPHYFMPVIDNLDASGLVQRREANAQGPRIVIEKPFGSDLAGAKDLNRRLAALFPEHNIFRMDHFLGKETVQNLLVLRFANAIFEPLWNRKYIASVQITMAETVGLEGRGAYFDRSGMLRDVVQNHLLELLALVAMEPPVGIDADAVRDEKFKLLRSIRRFSSEEAARYALRAQYSAGEVNGEPVAGYREEHGVADDSQTESYAALRLHIDNWRWAGTPFFVRAGKRLAARATEIVIRFEQAPHLVFEGQRRNIAPNTLVLRIQPDEGIFLSFSAKEPGPGLSIRTVPLEFHFAETFKIEPPEAYERLILDALLGDSTLFARADSIEQSWALIMPILDAWQQREAPLATYPAGSWGPPEADNLPADVGDRWLTPLTDCECD